MKAEKHCPEEISKAVRVASGKPLAENTSAADEAVGRMSVELSPERPEDRKYMRAAIRQAKRAAACGEVPIGCVIVCDGKVAGRGFNQRNTKHTTLAHAELTAIDRASRKLGDWRLEGCTLYVTLEPCQMCSGAIVQSRIDRVVIGTMNPKAGCAGSILNILQMPEFNHQVEMTVGVLREECTEMLQDFFRDLRVRNRREREIRNSACTDTHPDGEGQQTQLS